MEILTNSGWKKFDSIRKVDKSRYIEILTSKGLSLKCSEYHMLMKNSIWTHSKDLRVGDVIMTNNGYQDIISTRCIERDINLYDVINVKDTRSFFSNGILSHNCAFLGTTNTLISPRHIKNISTKKAIRKIEDFHIFEEPKEEHTYLTVVDTSRGKGLDYHAFVIIDITVSPYNVVATFKNNEIISTLYPDYIYRFCKYFNDSLILVEINDNGEEIANKLYDTFEYENLLATKNSGGRGGQILDFFGPRQKGIKTSQSVRSVGCSNLKSLIEHNKLFVNDDRIKFEIANFVHKGNKYQADSGFNDDLMMCLAIFAWCTTQNLFKEFAENGIRDQFSEAIANIEEELEPLGFSSIDTGGPSDEDIIIDSDGVWEKVF